MATLSVTVLNGLIPDLSLAASSRATKQGVDISSMTAAQKGQWLIAELLKDEIIKVRREKSEQTVTTTVSAAQATLLADIIQARTDVAGITG